MLLAPAGAVTILTVLLPMASVCRLSFFESDYLSERFVGLANYLFIFRDAAFLDAVVNSLIYGAAFAMGGVVIALSMAVYAYDLPRRWRDGIRIAVYLPTVAAGIIVSQVWLWVFHPSGGLANWLLSVFHLGPVRWFSARGTALAVLFLVISLSIPGMGFVLFLGALAGVPLEVLEAAKIDGASATRVRWGIAVPYIRSIVLLQLLMSVLAGLQVWEFVYAMTNGGPARGTESLMYYVYASGLLRGRYGVASAGSIVLLGIGLLGAWGIRRIRDA